MRDEFTVRRKPSAYRDWRIVYKGDLDTAKAKWQKIADDLRQGAVELLDPDGVRMLFESGPMVRTRW